MTGLVNTWRAMRLMIYLPLFDAVLGRLLLAGARWSWRVPTSTPLSKRRLRPTCASTTRSCCDYAPKHRQRRRLVKQMWMRRCRSPRVWERLLFELRAALDDFELRGGPALAALVDVVGRIPSDSALPEAVRARKLLRD